MNLIGRDSYYKLSSDKIRGFLGCLFVKLSVYLTDSFFFIVQPNFPQRNNYHRK